MTLCEKYRASCFADIKSKQIEISRIKSFFRSFPSKKAMILHGPPGTGKTSLAYALARETNTEIIELNASDLRNKEQISSILKAASQQQSLFGKTGKLILVDEVDGITRDDRGGLPELIALIKETKFPIIITANDIWDRKFSELRKKAEIVEIKELDYTSIFEIIKDISEKESLKIPDDLLKSIAIKAKGDVRAAINDIQTSGSEVLHSDIHERDKKQDIFRILRRVFKEMPSEETPFLYDKVNMNLDEIFLWIEENTPQEYKGKELWHAFESLSKADVFRGRIYRQQHWRFLVYENFFLSAGISAAKKQVKIGFTSYKRPSRILKIWMINRKNEQKKAIAEKYAKFCHISKKRALREFPIIKLILKNPEIQKQLKLEQKEIEFISKN
jgi:replication factor C large subunit